MTSLEIVLLILTLFFLSSTLILNYVNKIMVEKFEELYDDTVDRIDELDEYGKDLASDDREKQALSSICEKIEKIIDV